MAAKKKEFGGGTAPRFLDDDDDDDRVSRDVEEVERGLAAAGGEVELDEEDEEDDEPPAPEERRPSRGDRKRNRYSEMARERDAANQRTERLEREVAEMRGYLAGQGQRQQQTQQGGGRDELTEAHAQTFREEEELQEYIATLAQRDPRAAQAKSEDFRRKIQDIAMRRSRIEFAINQRDAAPQQHAANEQAFWRQLAQANQDVFGDRARLQYATGTYWLLTSQGKPESMDTINEALEATRAHFRLPTAKGPAPGAQRPTPEQARRYGGVPSGGTGNRAAVQIREENGRRIVTLDKTQRRMAVAMYPDMDPKKAMARFTKEVLLDEAPGRKNR